jgi:hypothetical protein
MTETAPPMNAQVIDRHGKLWVRMSPDRDPNIWRTEPPSLLSGWRSWKELQELEGPLAIVTSAIGAGRGGTTPQP